LFAEKGINNLQDIQDLDIFINVNQTKEANKMTNATSIIEEITNSSNFEKFFTYTTGELCKLSSVVNRAEEFAERKLESAELQELKDYFIEHIKGNAQARAEELIEREEVDTDEFSFTEFVRLWWLDKYVDA